MAKTEELTPKEFGRWLRRRMGRQSVTDGWLMRLDARLAKIVPPGQVFIAAGGAFMDTETGNLIDAEAALVLADTKDVCFIAEGAKPPAKFRKHRRIEL